MTENWWYAQGGMTYGPLPAGRLCNLVITGVLKAQDWLWTPGMPAWARAGTIPAFAEPLRAAGLPHASPGDAGPAPADLPVAIRPRRAGPWDRFWAQWLDIYLARTVLIVFLGIGGYRLETDSTRFMSFMAILPISLILQALMLSTLGTTPGKALLGLRVRRQDGGHIDARSLIRRQWLLWIKGLALGLPLIDLITQYRSKERLNRAHLTPWDEAAGTDVYQDEYGPGRLVLCMLLIIVVTIVGQMLADMAFHRFSVWHLP